MKNIDSVIAKVNDLLRLSKSSNANEAAAAASAANKLIDAHRLSIADLESLGEEPAEPVEEDPDYIYSSGKVTMWKRELLFTLAKHYGCCVWNDASWATGRQVSRFQTVGRKSDLAILRYMFAWLTAECARITSNFAGSGRIVINSYCEGFVSGIREQLAKSREEVKREATSNAIVLINSRTKEAEAWMYNQHQNLKTTKVYSHSRISKDAFRAGKEKGKNMHLGTALDVGSKIKMLT